MLDIKNHKRLAKLFICIMTFTLIALASGIPAQASTTYYVDATGGDDLNNGRSETTAWKTIGKVNWGVSFSPGDFILFKRGEVWREQLIPRSGDSSGYVTYGAYGTGNKPLLLGSVTRNNVSDWAHEGGNIWIALGLSVDVGNLIFDDEASVGVKVRNESELDTQGEFWYDQGNSVLKIYSQDNPAIYYSNIECALKRDIIKEDGKSYIIYENLDLRYGGAHGIGGDNVHHIIVRDSDFSYIGGGKQFGDIRYGNGIEFLENSNDILVQRCRLWEIYDAAVTTQGTGVNVQYNQFFRNNIIWNSEYCFEYANWAETSTTNNIIFENNTCVNAGHGWGHNQRWLETDLGYINGRHLAFYTNNSLTTNFFILNNIFYEAKSSDLFLSDPWNGIENAVFDHNVWYQSSGIMIYYLCASGSCAGEYTMNEFSQYQIDTGKGQNSIATDPLFINENNYDFRPVTGSPACTLSPSGDFVGALPCVDDTDVDGVEDSLDMCPFTPPVRVADTYYSSLQTAYEASPESAIVKSHGTVLNESLTFSINKSVDLESGYGCSYLISENTTTVSGDVTVSNGEVTIKSGTLAVN